MSEAMTEAEVERTKRGWMGQAAHADEGGSMMVARGYFATLDELDREMQARLASAPQALRDKWAEVVARTKADA